MTPSITRLVYWLGALVIGVSLYTSLTDGTSWPRVASSLALLIGFVLMGLYPTRERPGWARVIILALLAVAILLLVLRLTGTLV